MVVVDGGGAWVVLGADRVVEVVRGRAVVAVGAAVAGVVARTTDSAAGAGGGATAVVSGPAICSGG